MNKITLNYRGIKAIKTSKSNWVIEHFQTTWHDTSRFATLEEIKDLNPSKTALNNKKQIKIIKRIIDRMKKNNPIYTGNLSERYLMYDKCV